MDSRVPKNENGTIRKPVVSLRPSYGKGYEVDQHEEKYHNLSTVWIGIDAPNTSDFHLHTSDPPSSPHIKDPTMLVCTFDFGIKLDAGTTIPCISHARTWMSTAPEAPSNKYSGRFIPHRRPYKFIKQEPETHQVN